MKPFPWFLFAGLLAGCALGPDYERPATPTAGAYPEAGKGGDAVRAVMSRPSFRARPIDINVALAIIRDADVINSDEQVVAREVTHAHKNLDKDNEEVRARSAGFRIRRLPQRDARKVGRASVTTKRRR